VQVIYSSLWQLGFDQCSWTALSLASTGMASYLWVGKLSMAIPPQVVVISQHQAGV